MANYWPTPTVSQVEFPPLPTMFTNFNSNSASTRLSSIVMLEAMVLKLNSDDGDGKDDYHDD